MGKFDILAIMRSNNTVFTFKELLLAFSEQDPVRLRRQLSYYVKQGALYAIRRGLYAKDKNYNHQELATKIFTPSYVSFETVLAEAGVIFQHYSQIFVATYQTKEVICDGHTYFFRKIKDTILTNKLGIENKGNYFVASKERAFLDVLYLNKEYYFDNLSPLNRRDVFNLLPLYNNKRMESTVTSYFKTFDDEGA